MAVMKICTNYCVFDGDISDSSCIIKKIVWVVWLKK